jgi:hypothetical protein
VVSPDATIWYLGTEFTWPRLEARNAGLWVAPLPDDGEPAVPRDARSAPLDALALLAGERAAVRAFTADGERIAAVVATPGSPGELVLLADDGARVLTDWAQPLRDKNSCSFPARGTS